MCSTLIGKRAFLLGVNNIAKKTGIYTNCEYCGKAVYKTQTVYHKAVHHFCSTRCQALQKHKDTYEFRECPICRKSFEVRKTSPQMLCSPYCQHIWQTQQVGILNVKYNREHTQCDWCGKDLYRTPYDMKTKPHHFCNTNCRQAWYTNIYSQSEEWREESRKRAVNILTTKPPKINSKPQQIINDILDKSHINYRNEEPFVYYSIDNYLPDNNLMIEVMGDYWHSNPLKYSKEKINDKQKHIINRDKAKHTYVKNCHNIEILYLWEKDITKNPELCKALINEYINKQGVLVNYNSFNYSYIDSNLELNDNIIHSYQEL